MWKSSWWLARKELLHHWPAFIATLLAVMLLSMLAATLLWSYANSLHSGIDPYSHFILDMIFVGLTPAFSAIFMSGPYLNVNSIKQDPFGKRMAAYRSLPIPLDVLAGSRTLYMLTTLLTMSIVFYAIIFISLPGTFYELISRQDMIVFMLLWFGYALALGSMNSYLEFGTNGKMLWLISFLLVIVIIILFHVIYMMADISIVEWSFMLIETAGWWAAAISIACGGVCCFVMNRLLKIRLMRKDFV